MYDRFVAAATLLLILPIGYADGIYRRLSSVGGGVLIRGKRYPYAGTVTMDQIVVDVGNDAIDAVFVVSPNSHHGQQAIRAMKAAGNKVIGIMGARNRDLLILEDEFKMDRQLKQLTGQSLSDVVTRYDETGDRTKIEGFFLNFEAGTEDAVIEGRVKPVKDAITRLLEEGREARSGVFT